jgi:hypothetical protein
MEPLAKAREDTIKRTKRRRGGGTERKRMTTMENNNSNKNDDHINVLHVRKKFEDNTGVISNGTLRVTFNWTQTSGEPIVFEGQNPF